MQRKMNEGIGTWAADTGCSHLPANLLATLPLIHSSVDITDVLATSLWRLISGT